MLALDRIAPEDYAGYIFDNDGTLVLSMDLHFEAFRHAFAQNGAEFEYTREVCDSVAGSSMHDCVRRLNERFGQSLDPHRVIEDQEAYFWEHLDRVEPNPPVVDFARRVAPHRPVAVASGGLSATVNKTLQVIGLDRLFPVVVTAEDVRRSKPAPDPFLLAARLLGVPPEGCLVIEDSRQGIAAAEAAGMDSVYVGAR